MTTLSLRSFSEFAREHECPLSEAFLMKEVEETGRDRQELWDLMVTRLAVMRHAMKRGLESPQYSRSGLVQGGAHRMKAWTEQGHSLLSPAMSRMIAAALAVSEVNACMGRVVAAPTAGSCGVMPAVLFSVAQERGLDEDALVRGLFVAGGIGLVIEKRATLSGAEGGCQAEVGSASAMAAGALVEMMGGTPEQVEAAVSFALANVLGLICDPVMGLVEEPCVRRNVMGAVNAVSCAEMALAGLPCFFAADGVIDAMGRVGRRLPEDYRETARGGLAVVPMVRKPEVTS